MSLPSQAGYPVALAIPDELLQALAERTAALVTEQLSRDRLYKLTAARAIPFRKKRDGQGLLFRRDELDRWVEAEYESTGCVA